MRAAMKQEDGTGLSGIVYSLACLLVWCCDVGTAVARDALRPWLSGDSIAVRRYEDVSLGFQPSPDGRYFFSLSERGDLQSDQAVLTLQVFGVAEVRAQLKSRGQAVAVPLFETSVRSVGAGDTPIQEPKWDADSHSVYFRAMTDRGRFEARRFDVTTGTVEVLSDVSTSSIMWFSHRAGRQLFISSWGEQWPTNMQYPMQPYLLDRNGWSVRLFGLQSLESHAEFFTSQGRNGRRDVLEPFATGAISPDGRLAVIQALGRFVLLKFDAEQPPQMLMNVPMTTGPKQGNARIFWSANSEQLVLVGARAPTDSLGGAVQESSGSDVVAYQVATNTWHPLASVLPGTSLESAQWSEPEGRLTVVLLAKGRRERIEFRLVQGKWSRRDVSDMAEAVSPLKSLTVRLRQSENDPPRLVAEEGGRELALTPPDPALGGVRIRRIQRFRWRDHDDQIREGGLVLPAGFRLGKPVPVVIQPYNYESEQFRPDGNNTTADASQALAARGMAVLTVSIRDLIEYNFASDTEAARREGPAFVRRIDAIVDGLVEQGIATPSKVAITGFSRGGFLSYYAITHPGRTCLAAVVIADSFTGGYPAYLTTVVRDPVQLKQFVAGESFWNNRQQWLREETTFNADRVPTPALFSRNLTTRSKEEAATEDIPYESLITLGAFRLNHKPIEFLFFKNAAHQLRNPLQRVAMMHSVIDWMAFWMLGEENPDPARAVQNERWRKLRAEWQEVKAKDPSRGEAGFVTTRSGLMYAIRTRVTGKAAEPGDVLRVNYVGVLPDGTQFANTYKSGTPRMLTLSSTSNIHVRPTANTEEGTRDPAGGTWDEALRLLHAGERATFIMPRELALNARDSDQTIPANATHVRYEVELVGIQRAGVAAGLRRH